MKQPPTKKPSAIREGSVKKNVNGPPDTPRPPPPKAHVAPRTSLGHEQRFCSVCRGSGLEPGIAPTRAGTTQGIPKCGACGGTGIAASSQPDIPRSSNVHSLLEDLRNDDRVSMQHTAWIEERAADELNRQRAEVERLQRELKIKTDACEFHRNRGKQEAAERDQLREALKRISEPEYNAAVVHDGDTWVEWLQQIAKDALSGKPASAHETSAWQSIETAPRGTSGDAVRILLATAGDDRSRHVGYWDAYYAQGGSGYRGGDGWVIDAAGEEYRLHHNGPTHWMQLPASPQSESADHE